MKPCSKMFSYYLKNRQDFYWTSCVYILWYAIYIFVPVMRNMINYFITSHGDYLFLLKCENEKNLFRMKTIFVVKILVVFAEMFFLFPMSKRKTVYTWYGFIFKSWKRRIWNQQSMFAKNPLAAFCEKAFYFPNFLQ